LGISWHSPLVHSLKDGVLTSEDILDSTGEGFKAASGLLFIETLFRQGEFVAILGQPAEQRDPSAFAAVWRRW
jgi:hypothetical protein